MKKWTDADKVRGWYNGEYIESKIVYNPSNEYLDEIIDNIDFVGLMSVEPGANIQMALDITFKDKTYKRFEADQNEDGSFSATVFEDLLEKADKYLATLI